MVLALGYWRVQECAAMATPGQLLTSILNSRGIKKSEFARRIQGLGLGDCAYHNVFRWTKDREFSSWNRKRAARALEVADDYFDEPEEAVLRDRETARVRETFLATRPVATSLSPAELEVLCSMRFHDPRLRPTVAFFESVAFALRGLIPLEEVLQVAEENDLLDRTIAAKDRQNHR